MQETYTTKAIVLKRYPVRENDSHIVLYSREKGKIDLVARGTNKSTSKLAAHLEPMNLSHFMVVKGRQYDYVGSAVSEKCHGNIKEDLDKLILAGQGVHIFNKLIKSEQKDERIFNALSGFLDLMNDYNIPAKEQACAYGKRLLLHFFLYKLMVELGYRPELHLCTSCKARILPDGNYFANSKGGLICGGCVSTIKDKDEKINISENCIKILRIASFNDLKNMLKYKISNELSKEVMTIVGSFSNYIINRDAS